MMATDVYMGAVRLVLFDVDGVLTDGSLHFNSGGEALKTFNVRDGVAVALLHAHGLKAGVLSGRSSGALDFRVAELGFDIAMSGRSDKAEAFDALCKRGNLNPDEIVYVGDDVMDIPLAGRVGCFYAPRDAHPLILERADHVLATPGGYGVAREVAEHVLLSGGLSLPQAYYPLLNNRRTSDAVH